jgi:hypothetical protein
MAFENLPGIFPKLIDGNLKIASVNENPVVLVVGTAPRGTSEELYVVNSVSEAARVFGRSDGTLVRGLYEVVAGGAENIRMLRVGATAARLAKIGDATSTLTLETVMKDDQAGLSYKLFWDQSEGRLRVWRVSDDMLVYDNNPAYPSAAVDENEVSITGSAGATGIDIGTEEAPVTLVDADDSPTKNVYTAGTDGILLSRMELFERLFVAYRLLENEDLDVIVPQNVYLDDANVCDMTSSEVVALQTSAPWASTPTYPDASAFHDVLGKVFAQEYQGSWYFWWDMDNDGVAEIWPTVGSSDEETDAYGVALEAADFHEANFGYQLADFCYRQSEDNAEMIGVIGMLPPISWSLKDVSNWVGRTPVLDVDSAGNAIVVTNGSGLLGNKWTAGRKALSGKPGHFINGIDGLAGGGFIGTDSGWPDGEQLKDRNDHLVDIGKYISVVGAQAILANPTSPSSYAASSASVYGGFVSSLPANSAPTNKVQPGVRLPFRVSVAKLDQLAGHGIVMLQQKVKGIVVADAPTGARTACDYRRLTTIRIVKATIDAIRAAAEPYLGEPITGARLAALETAINAVLVKLQKAEFLQRFNVAVTSTPTQQIQGKADVELVLVPAFELRQITVNVALAAQ